MSRWTQEELQTIKDVFKDEGFVLAVRNVMTGLQDKFEHKTTDGVLRVLEKNLNPKYEANVPLEMQQDLCKLSLGFIVNFEMDEGVRRIKAYDLVQDYLERRLEVLKGKEDTGDTLDDFKDKTKAKDEEDRFIRMLAYLQFCGYVDKSLSELVQIANAKELTEEELKLKQLKDSNK